MPVHCMPVHCMPVHCMPVHCMPVHCMPVHCMPVHCMPVHCMPVHCMPVHCMPYDSSLYQHYDVVGGYTGTLASLYTGVFLLLAAADGPVDDLYVEMRPIKAGDVCPGDDACPMGEVCAEDDEVDYIHMNPVTLPTHPSLPSVPSLPSKTRAPSLPSRSEMGTLYHPPGAFAPICAADQVLPPRKTHSESVHMDPATHPALTALSSKPFPHQTSAPCLSLGSGVGALYPPPTGPAPIYAAIDQLLPPRKISFTGESLHYASSDLFSKRS